MFTSWNLREKCFLEGTSKELGKTENMVLGFKCPCP